MKNRRTGHRRLEETYSRRMPAQGYVRIRCRDESGKVVYDSLKEKNTVVNDARRSAAAAFAGLPGLVGLGFTVDKYRCGYSDTLDLHWDVVNNKPLEAPVTQTALLPQYDGTQTVDYFHTQASVDGLMAHGLQWNGTGNPLVPAAIPVDVDYPFNSDEFAVQLTVTLDALTSVGATFDTVEIILTNGVKMAHRWTFPIVKQAGWSLAIEHLILF